MFTKSTEYLGATADPTEPAKHPFPEFAIAGRSNVGKSTLINALVGARIARTSKTPGRTQLLHFVCYRKNAVLVDLPGLGFAKAPKNVQRKIENLALNTLRFRESLHGLLLLVDIRRTPGDIERQILDHALQTGLKVLVVATKCDQISKHQRKPAINKLVAWSGLGRHAAIAASSNSGEGMDAIHHQLEKWAKTALPPSDEGDSI